MSFQVLRQGYAAAVNYMYKTRCGRYGPTRHEPVEVIKGELLLTVLAVPESQIFRCYSVTDQGRGSDALMRSIDTLQSYGY